MTILNTLKVHTAHSYNVKFCPPIKPEKFWQQLFLMKEKLSTNRGNMHCSTDIQYRGSASAPNIQ